MAHLPTDVADAVAGYLLLFAASMSACFIIQSHEHMRHHKESSRNTQLEERIGDENGEITPSEGREPFSGFPLIM